MYIVDEIPASELNIIWKSKMASLCKTPHKILLCSCYSQFLCPLRKKVELDYLSLNQSDGRAKPSFLNVSKLLPILIQKNWKILCIHTQSMQRTVVLPAKSQHSDNFIMNKWQSKLLYLAVVTTLTASIFESGPMPTPLRFLEGPPILPSCKVG